MNQTEIAEAVAQQQAYIDGQRAVRDKNCPTCRMAYGCACRDENGVRVPVHPARLTAGDARQR